MMNLRDICLTFLEQDDDAKSWGGEPDDFADAPDCNVMAKRFDRFVMIEYGLSADAVKVKIEARDDSCTDLHWFTVIDGMGVAVDWTARQFHNVQGMDLDVSEIPSPLLFLWPGPYPLPTITAEEA